MEMFSFFNGWLKISKIMALYQTSSLMTNSHRKLLDECNILTHGRLLKVKEDIDDAN